jgi:hypothetical protein
MPPQADNIPFNASFNINEEDMDTKRASKITASLRKELCQMRNRYEEIETDRNFIAMKLSELQEVLKAYQDDEVQQFLMEKSIKVADAALENACLRGQLKKLEKENQSLRQEREHENHKMLEMSGLVRSLQSTPYSEDDEEDDETSEDSLTPEKALDMTLKNLKMNIEGLEDERQRLAAKCKAQAQRIRTLRAEKEQSDVKVEMLEELFRSLNQTRAEEEQNEALKETTESFDPRTERRERRERRRQEFTKTNSTPDLCVEETADSSSIPAPTRSITSRRNRREEMKKASSVSSLELIKEREPEATKAQNMSIKCGGLEGSYTGALVDGAPNGTGTIRFDNGDTYLGEVVNGEMHGKGTLYHRLKEIGISRGYFDHNVFAGACRR